MLFMMTVVPAMLLSDNLPLPYDDPFPLNHSYLWSRRLKVVNLHPDFGGLAGNACRGNGCQGHCCKDNGAAY